MASAEVAGSLVDGDVPVLPAVPDVPSDVLVEAPLEVVLALLLVVLSPVAEILVAVTLVVGLLSVAEPLSVSADAIPPPMLTNTSPAERQHAPAVS